VKKRLLRNKATASGKWEIPYYNSWSFSLQIGCTIGRLFRPNEHKTNNFSLRCAAFASSKTRLMTVVQELTIISFFAARSERNSIPPAGHVPRLLPRLPRRATADFFIGIGGK
jgi:hypothetical protein